MRQCTLQKTPGGIAWYHINSILGRKRGFFILEALELQVDK